MSTNSFSPGQPKSNGAVLYWSNYWQRRRNEDGPSGKQSAGPVQSIVLEGLRRDGTLSGKRVLEIGCGNSALNELLKGVRYTGVDFAPNAIEMAKRRVLEKRQMLDSNSYSFVVADVTRPLPLNRAAFDIVFSMETLHLLGSKMPMALENIARVTKPGGLFIFDIYHINKYALSASAEKGYKALEFDYGTVLRREANEIEGQDELVKSSPAQLRLALDRAGFDAPEIRSWGFNESRLHLAKLYPDKIAPENIPLTEEEFDHFSIARAIRR